MNLQRPDARRQVDHARQAGRDQRTQQQLDAQAQAQVEHHVAEFDQHVGVTRAADANRNIGIDPQHDRVVVAAWAEYIGCGDAGETNAVAGSELAQLPQLVRRHHRGADEAARLGPSGPSRIGMSPVKSMLPTA